MGSRRRSSGGVVGEEVSLVVVAGDVDGDAEEAEWDEGSSEPGGVRARAIRSPCRFIDGILIRYTPSSSSKG